MPLQVDNCKFCQKASYKYTNMALKKENILKGVHLLIVGLKVGKSESI